jgi:hypothetical protein
MRRTSVLSILAATVAVGTAACVPPGGGGPGPAPGNQTNCATRTAVGGDVAVVGLVADGSLVCVTGKGAELGVIGTLAGLDQDTSLVGIDYRPANNVLYGVGNAGGVYSIDAGTAMATLVSRLNQPLQGTSFGVDFNPTVDRLRIISDAGQSLRANVDDGTATVDGALNIPGPPPVSPALGVTGAAYTNNDADPTTATTLFDIDTTNDNTVIQAPANAGALSPTGKLGVDATATVGFDIYSDVVGGTTVSLRALASIAAADGSTKLYSVDLLGGKATPLATWTKA